MNISPKITPDTVSKYIYFTTPRELDAVSDDCQGVYGWYAPPPSKISPPIDEKTYSHYSAICRSAGRELLKGKRYSTEVFRQSLPQQSYYVNKLSDRHVIELSAVATVFSAPLYVGKACGKEGVKRRLLDESKSEDFKRKFLRLAAGNDAMPSFNFKNCLIKYVDVRSLLIDGLSVELEQVDYIIEDACKFLEQAVFWAAFPPLNKKMGV